MALHDSESFPDTIQMFIGQFHMFVLLGLLVYTQKYDQCFYEAGAKYVSFLEMVTCKGNF